MTALLGPNGAGKSSLVLAVGGVLRPKAGAVLLDGRSIYAGRRPERIRRAGIAIVPEGRRLLPELTVEDNLRVATYTLSREQAQAGRERALELFPELSRRLRPPARSLSGGEQQMVVLAQALVSQPRFMLIDELSLGLAPVVVNRLIPTIRAVAESGIGVLLIEQFATVALGLANQRPHHGGRPDPVLGPGQRAAREAGAAPVGVPAARQQRPDTAKGRLRQFPINLGRTDWVTSPCSGSCRGSGAQPTNRNRALLGLMRLTDTRGEQWQPPLKSWYRRSASWSTAGRSGSAGYSRSSGRSWPRTSAR